MGTTSLLMSSTPSKREKQLDHLEREFQKARLELDEKRCLVERKQQLFTQMLEEEYAMAASFLQKQEVDVSCAWESLHRCIEEYDLEARETATSSFKTDRNRGREFIGNPTGKIDANWKRSLHKIKFHSIEEEEVWVIVLSKISLI
ncbi:MAG: hypothetical protein ACLT8H_06925 [Streptococcus parasanguinis]